MKPLAWFGVAGAIAQLMYGIGAVLDPYPGITSPGWEMLWLVINLAMVASIGAWVMGHPAGGRLTRWGGLVAGVGHALRAVVSAVLVVNQDAPVDAAIVAAIVLMFGGMAAIAVASLRTKSGWAPATVLATGLAAASTYSLDKHLHFILLGLVWGGAWMWLASINTRKVPAGQPLDEVSRAR